MGIIPVFHVVPTNLPAPAAGVSVQKGMLLALNSSTNKTALCYSGASNNVDRPIGLAADRTVAAESYEWVNRISDMGNDTAASGLISAYMSGGEFYVDLDDSTITTPAGTAIKGVIVNGSTVTVGTYLYPGANSGAAGQLSSTQTNSNPAVAIITETSSEISSGIPGEYEPGSSVAYADDTDNRNWVKIKLLI